MSSDHPLLQEIQKGESQNLEFKEQLPKRATGRKDPDCFCQY